MTSSYLNEMYDVIGVNVLPRKLMKFPAKKRSNRSLPHYSGVNHLIIEHDQIPFVHFKIGILLQSRGNSLDEFNVWDGD